MPEAPQDGAQQASNDDGPTRLHLTVENVVTLGAGLDTHARAQAMADAAAEDARPRRKSNNGQRKPRRVRKERERGKEAVWAAVCPGSRPARHVIRWLRGIEALPEYQLARKDLKKNIRQFAQVLAQCPGFDPASMTIMPLWARLQERHGYAKSTLISYMRRLHDWGVLGTVAKGRTAQFTPKSSGRNENEAAIYVLLERVATEPVEKTWSPVPTRAVNNPPHATREEDSLLNIESAPPLTSSRRSAARLAVDELMRSRKGPFWSPTTTQSPMTKARRRETERLAAAECQFRNFPLRDISTAHIAYLIRPFLRAGWTVNDILHALDNRPTTNARYHHDGATGVGNLGAWIKHRLRPWIRPDGSFYRSPSQKSESTRIQHTAERAAFNARRQQATDEAQSQRGSTTAQASPGWRETYAAAFAAGLEISQAKTLR
ncbi:hypothetical protein ACT3TS_17560 [Specibacter sp. AOP5-B1-6]|uniref:hypothetical protein n=1 Tax=Specibacter sp. AOP5-B1-6 TaxID=3457653 RepID=UPI00402B3C04